jgi:excisionase family DNA binding protein
MDLTAQALTIADIAGRPTIRVEEAAILLGIGRSTAFEAARRGELPTIRIGRRLLVPVPQLLAQLGAQAAPTHSP